MPKTYDYVGPPEIASTVAEDRTGVTIRCVETDGTLRVAPRGPSTMASEDTPEARGRLQQDTTFSMDELEGRSLRRLTAARLEGGEPLCLYVEVDAPGCHRMFLDAGLAVWEDWGGITEDDRELELDDLLTDWCLDGAVVRSAAALTGPRDGAARFEIDLGERGTVVLETSDGELDGPCRVVLRARGP